MENKDRFLLECDCSCTKIEFEKDNEDKDSVCFVSIFHNVFYAQQTLVEIIIERIKYAWKILIGQGYKDYDIVVDNENMKSLADWISKNCG